MSTQIQFKSYSERREQQQDFVNGNLIHGERGVCNSVHAPWTVWLDLDLCRSGTYSYIKTENVHRPGFLTHFSQCIFSYIFMHSFLERVVCSSFDRFVLLKEIGGREQGGAGLLPFPSFSLASFFGVGNESKRSEACSSSLSTSPVMKWRRIKVVPQTKVQSPIKAPIPQG